MGRRYPFCLSLERGTVRVKFLCPNTTVSLLLPIDIAGFKISLQRKLYLQYLQIQFNLSFIWSWLYGCEQWKLSWRKLTKILMSGLRSHQQPRAQAFSSFPYRRRRKGKRAWDWGSVTSSLIISSVPYAIDELANSTSAWWHKDMSGC